MRIRFPAKLPESFMCFSTRHDEGKRTCCFFLYFCVNISDHWLNIRVCDIGLASSSCRVSIVALSLKWMNEGSVWPLTWEACCADYLISYSTGQGPCYAVARSNIFYYSLAIHEHNIHVYTKHHYRIFMWSCGGGITRPTPLRSLRGSWNLSYVSRKLALRWSCERRQLNKMLKIL